MTPTSHDGSVDPPRRQVRVLVPPNADDEPTGGTELQVGVAVPANVRRELRPPPGSVPLRVRSMEWAAVPEATIDENGDAVSPE